jgi:putative NADH-flavin reductase
MHLFILGATGGTGRALLAQAGSHQITALVRSPQKLTSPGVRVVKGDPRNAAQLGAAMSGCDAVISALGPPLPPRNWPRATTLLGDAARATIEAMTKAGVRRLLVVSGDIMFTDRLAFLRATLLRHLYKDDVEMERATQASGLDWTIARPTRLTDGALSGVYRTESGRLPERPRPVSRADVAHFLLGAAERRQHLGEIVGLAR